MGSRGPICREVLPGSPYRPGFSYCGAEEMWTVPIVSKTENLYTSFLPITDLKTPSETTLAEQKKTCEAKQQPREGYMNQVLGQAVVSSFVHYNRHSFNELFGSCTGLHGSNGRSGSVFIFFSEPTTPPPTDTPECSYTSATGSSATSSIHFDAECSFTSDVGVPPPPNHLTQPPVRVHFVMFKAKYTAFYLFRSTNATRHTFGVMHLCVPSSTK